MAMKDKMIMIMGAYSNEYISGLVKIAEITEGVEVLENYPRNIEVMIDTKR